MTRLALFPLNSLMAGFPGCHYQCVGDDEAIGCGSWGGRRPLSRERSGRLLRAKRRQQRLLCSAFANSVRSDPFRLSARSDRLPRTRHRIICFATTTTAIGMRIGWCGSHRPPLECEAGNKDYVSRNTAIRTLFHFSIHVILHLVYSASNVDPTGSFLSQDGKRAAGQQLVSGLN